MARWAENHRLKQLDAQHRRETTYRATGRSYPSVHDEERHFRDRFRYLSTL